MNMFIWAVFYWRQFKHELIFDSIEPLSLVKQMPT
jgi:hypothetical protein